MIGTASPSIRPRSIGNFDYTSETVTADPIPFVVKAAIAIAIASPILLARFQLNVGSYFLNVGLAAQYLLLLVLFLKGFLRFNPVRFLLFVSCLTVVLLSWILNSDVSSSSSVLLLVASYAAFVFVAGTPDGSGSLARWAANAYMNVMLFCAAAGILQFFLQIVIKSDWLIDFTPYIPPEIQGGGKYNTAYKVGTFYKSNGFFLREPARFSQFLAIAILCELSIRKSLRPVRLATLGLALLLSYSGTGLLTLAFGLMFPLGRRTIVRGIVLAVGGLLVFGLLGSVLNLSVTTSRIHEFSAEGSSGYARFVAPFIFIIEYANSTPWSLLIGHGPGSTSRSAAFVSFAYQVSESTWNKLVFEYGILGFLSLTGLVFYSLIRARGSAELAAALCLGWIILWGGVMLNADALCIVYVLLGIWAAGPRLGRSPQQPPVR